jgi:hypothetical protein
MRRTRFVLILLTLLALPISMRLYAQMKGDKTDSDTSQTRSSQSSDEQAGPTFLDLAQNSADRSTEIRQDFKRLETSFQEMMKVSDMAALKARMKDFQAEMASLGQAIDHNSELQERMVSFLRSGQVPVGMMRLPAAPNMTGMGEFGQGDQENR